MEVPGAGAWPNAVPVDGAAAGVVVPKLKPVAGAAVVAPGVAGAAAGVVAPKENPPAAGGAAAGVFVVAPKLNAMLFVAFVFEFEFEAVLNRLLLFIDAPVIAPLLAAGITKGKSSRQ